jgi:NAD(P)-dependent dehydrogenase (short-subunit alcohol dehydrogenase family)
MSKAALERMCLSVAEEVRPDTIAVNVLSPGRVDTWMHRRGDWPGPHPSGAACRDHSSGALAGPANGGECYGPGRRAGRLWGHVGTWSHTGCVKNLRYFIWSKH